MTGPSPSFERIDYQFRYNKYIERKLVFDLLTAANPDFGFSNYRYLGLGSIWFSDFRLAHRTLGLTDMISMEFADHAERAVFNQPYRTINVKPGISTDTLSKFVEEDWVKPVITWLDYDGALEPGVVKDLEILINNVAVDSVLFITLNAGRNTYRPRVDRSAGNKSREFTALGQIEGLLGPGTVPARFEVGMTPGGAHNDIDEKNFPEFIAEAMQTFLAHKVAKSGRTLTTSEGGLTKTNSFVFVPLLNCCHKDGVEMITVGGAITTEDKVPLWRKTLKSIVPVDARELPTHQRLDLIPLTFKEKIALDKCLPHTEADFIQMAKAEGVKLEDNALLKYFKFYQQFPVFFESQT